MDPAGPQSPGWYNDKDYSIDARWIEGKREFAEREAEQARRKGLSYQSPPLFNFRPKTVPDVPLNQTSILRSGIAQSVDPNEIVGPSGYGTANYLASDGVFAYRVNFENYEEATAPAQVVMIENPVPANLDIDTLELTTAGFGDQLFTIPAGTQHYEHTAKMTFNVTDFDVLIEVKLDRENRKVLARFESIIPLTGLLPPVDVGFLPPEDGSGRGKGHIAYLVKPETSISTGTEIRNIGFITSIRRPAARLSAPTFPSSPIQTPRPIQAARRW